ncbi:uncharacterized protein LOC111887512 [Lactuca sativa]|uniref:uncharacterized protein LOC111887512 n=1 Tax=Lactuca sativa TaxID=4236 RepID=UPI000CD87823|nr:uncharacterized protein LOC111887512 [Lactuca sativa]
MWIFCTIFEPLLQMVLKKVSSAHEMWSDLENQFRTNKDTKIIQLDNELRTITQGDYDIASYCTRIKSITNMLDNIDSIVPEKNIVIYTINGLHPKFENVATIIHHSDPLPSFLKVRSMLMDQEQRLKQIATPPNSSATSSSPTILISEQQHQNINNPSSSENFNHRGGRTSGPGRGRGGESRGGRWSHNSSQHVHTPRT